MSKRNLLTTPLRWPLFTYRCFRCITLEEVFPGDVRALCLVVLLPDERERERAHIVGGKLDEYR